MSHSCSFQPPPRHSRTNLDGCFITAHDLRSMFAFIAWKKCAGCISLVCSELKCTKKCPTGMCSAVFTLSGKACGISLMIPALQGCKPTLDYVVSRSDKQLTRCRSQQDRGVQTPFLYVLEINGLTYTLNMLASTLCMKNEFSLHS